MAANKGLTLTQRIDNSRRERLYEDKPHVTAEEERRLCAEAQRALEDLALALGPLDPMRAPCITLASLFKGRQVRGRRDGSSAAERQAKHQQAKHEAHLKAQREADAAWKIPAARREGLLLRVLGDEQLLVRELTSRLNTELGFPSPENRNQAVFQGNVRSLVMRMVRSGQLERAPESFKNKVRYRYARTQGGA